MPSGSSISFATTSPCRANGGSAESAYKAAMRAATYEEALVDIVGHTRMHDGVVVLVPAPPSPPLQKWHIWLKFYANNRGAGASSTHYQ